MRPTIAFLLVSFCLPAFAGQPAAAKQYRGILTREAHFVNGLSAPVPMYAAQIEQESGWKAGITAWDNGKGLGQFMDGTADTIVTLYPELKKPAPYNPTWAIRALVRYNTWLGKHVQAVDDCNRRAAALTAYNGGLGYVQDSQSKATIRGQWFQGAETVKTRQSAANFAASRLYPRKIIFDRQPHYVGWGTYTCEEIKP